jgi:hypothetical protein
MLTGISCLPGGCVAVGSSTLSGSQVTFAESWNGTSWAVLATPNPAGTSSSELDAVSCVSSLRCTAVGTGVTSNGNVTLAEASNGTTWSIQPTPNLTGRFAFSYLNGVSCPSAAACMAVGHDGISSNTLAESWAG